MPGYSFSRRAERDLDEIADYTRGQWGNRQAILYIEALRALCVRLAEAPETGRCCEDIPGLHRMESGSHVVFYRIKHEGIRVSRILHRRMLPSLHKR